MYWIETCSACYAGINDLLSASPSNVDRSRKWSWYLMLNICYLQGEMIVFTGCLWCPIGANGSEWCKTPNRKLLHSQKTKQKQTPYQTNDESCKYPKYVKTPTQTQKRNVANSLCKKKPPGGVGGDLSWPAVLNGTQIWSTRVAFQCMCKQI